MKTKKLITLLALLMAALFVSAQTYMDQEDIRLEKERLDVLNQQISFSDFNTGYFDRTWMQFTDPVEKYTGYRTLNSNKENSYNGYPSSYVQFFEENGYRWKVVEDNNSFPLQRKVYQPGTPENGRKPVVP